MSPHPPFQSLTSLNRVYTKYTEYYCPDQNSEVDCLIIQLHFAGRFQYHPFAYPISVCLFISNYIQYKPIIFHGRIIIPLHIVTFLPYKNM